MNWKHAVNFNTLTAQDLYQILKLRQDVFIIEQHCIYADIDNLDQKSEHIMLFKGEKLAAYARLVPGGVKFDEISIGRIAVDPQYRGMLFGKRLVEKAIEIIKSKNEKVIRIEAQEYLLEFYEAAGFKKASDSYPVDGIAHVEMVLVLDKK